MRLYNVRIRTCVKVIEYNSRLGRRKSTFLNNFMSSSEWQPELHGIKLKLYRYKDLIIKITYVST